MSAVTFHTNRRRPAGPPRFERPFFGRTKLYVGGELHDLTVSDDQWQVSSLEASLAALGPRLSYRDYYRRRGVQINAAVRINPHVEALFAWRGERQEPLTTSSDFSFWNATGRSSRMSTLARVSSMRSSSARQSTAVASIASRSTRRTAVAARDAVRERLKIPTKRDTTPIWRID
jgi:hypothetical protein